MESAEQPDATKTARASNLTLCRVAAFGGISGAIITQGALLVGCYWILVDGFADRWSLAALMGVVTIGTVLMIVARRHAGREQRRGADLDRATLRLVSEPSEGRPTGTQKSAA
jgi:hypothetical protein